MGSKEGNRQVSAGIFPYGDNSTARVPTIKAAIVLAATIWMSKSEEFINKYRAECPTAAIIAQNRYAFFGGLLIDANPMAAIAAKRASCRT